MMDHRTWYEFVLFTYRTRFEEVLEVVDSIALEQWMKLRVLFKKRHADVAGCRDLKIFASRYCY
jgi:CRP/FNR family transcriptional regulator